MSSPRENSPDRHVPRPTERGEHRRHRRRTQGSKQSRREETTEDALNDFYGGTANIDGSQEAIPIYGESHRPSQARKSKPWTRTRPQRPPMPQGFHGSAGIPSDMYYEHPSDPYGWISNEDDLYLSEPPDGNWRRGEWIHAAKEVASPREPSAEHRVMSLGPTLVVTRRGRRLTSDPFFYEKRLDGHAIR
jgi:hypothetical protein